MSLGSQGQLIALHDPYSGPLNTVFSRGNGNRSKWKFKIPRVAQFYERQVARMSDQSEPWIQHNNCRFISPKIYFDGWKRLHSICLTRGRFFLPCISKRGAWSHVSPSQPKSCRRWESPHPTRPSPFPTAGASSTCWTAENSFYTLFVSRKLVHFWAFPLSRNATPTGCLEHPRYTCLTVIW